MTHIEAIQAGCDELGWNDSDLSRASGITRSTISRIKSGSINMRADMLIKILTCMPGIKFTDTDAGFVMTQLPTDEDYMAALGPCGK
jgi:predicted transcriptional regulator